MPKKSFKTKKLNSNSGTDGEVRQEKDKAVKEFCNNHEFEKPIATHSRTLVISLVISIVFGFIAGLVCLFLFLSGAFSGSGIFSWLDIDSLLPTAQVIIEKNEQTTVLEDERVVEVLDKVSPSVVGIFNYKKPITDVQQDSYTVDEFLGNGLVLTNDGWIATTNDVVNDPFSKYVVITQDGQVLLVEDIKQDAEQGLVFLKVKTDNLPAASLIWWQNINPGERTILLSGLEHVNQDLLISRVASREFQLNQKLIKNTESYYLYISLVDELDQTFLGTPVFNLNKQVMGLVANYNNNNYIIPIDYLKKSFDQLLSKGEIEKPYLGIEYVNLAAALNPDFSESGALILNIKKDSPLKDLAVEIGDIIIKVDDDNLNGNKNLTNLIQEYKIGNKITLTILDKDDITEKKIEAVLGGK